MMPLHGLSIADTSVEISHATNFITTTLKIIPKASGYSIFVSLLSRINDSHHASSTRTIAWNIPTVHHRAFLIIATISKEERLPLPCQWKRTPLERLEFLVKTQARHCAGPSHLVVSQLSSKKGPTALLSDAARKMAAAAEAARAAEKH